MKKILKISTLVLLLLFSAFAATFLISYFTIPDPIPQTKDSDGYIITRERIPYYQYREDWDYNEYDAKLWEELTGNYYFSEEYPEFKISDYKDGVCIHYYCGKEENVVIPETIDGKKVIRIDYNFYTSECGEYISWSTAFYNDFYQNVEDTIKSIHLPSGLKYIAEGAFGGARDSLEKITVDENNPYYFSLGGMLFSKETKQLLFSPWLENTNALIIIIMVIALIIIFVIIKFVKYIKLRKGQR